MSRKLQNIAINVAFAALFWIALGVSMEQAHAMQDGRLALLVANQQGWKGDPKLQYAIKGDLQPLARSLRRIGFRVRVLKNKGAASVRRALTKLRREFQKRSKISTFLFYYSGHADRRHFHFGPRSRHPMGFREFAKIFQQLRVSRRVAIIDSCYSGQIIREFGSIRKFKRLVKEGHAKGVYARRPVNIRRMMKPTQGKEYGTRIISSSLHLAWELHRYKASIFTHHLLKGLRNLADLNRDGKITIDELFDYASREVTRETGQRPQQLIMVQREQPYALAPAYYSRLLIGPRVLGRLEVRVGNFLWTYHKRRRKTLRLATMDGVGKVYLRQRHRCWHQPIRMPKGGELKLGRRWKSVTCPQSKGRRKGVVYLPPYVYGGHSDRGPRQRQTQRHYHSRRRSFHNFVGLSLGYTQLGTPRFLPPSLSGTLHWRFGIPNKERRASKYPNYWATELLFRNGIDVTLPFRASGLGLSAEDAPWTKGTRWLGRANIRSEGGWSIPISFLGAFNIYPHLYLQLSGTLLALPQDKLDATIMAGGGAGFEVTWWFHPQMSLQWAVQGGIDITLVSVGNDNPVFLHLKSYVGVFFAI